MFSTTVGNSARNFPTVCLCRTWRVFFFWIFFLVMCSFMPSAWMAQVKSSLQVTEQQAKAALEEYSVQMFDEAQLLDSQGEVSK